MELIFASHNENKVKEVRKILGKEFKIRSLNEIGFHDEIPENHATIEGMQNLNHNTFLKNII